MHLFPYWEGVDVESAVDFCFRELKAVQAAYPKKPVIIGEIGWPSEGRIRAGAVASVSNEALFLRRFLARAEKEGERYYIMEAFDQPWKARDEGAVGAYWGIYDVNRQPKFEFTAPIVRIPAWHMLAAISVTLALLMLGVFYMHSGSLRTRGRTLLAIVVYAAATITVWVIYDYTQQYLTPTSLVVGSLLILGMLGVVAVLFAEAHEWAEAHWAGAHARLLDPTRHGGSLSIRKVSVHLPAYNEPPDMLIETLDALARLDYPNFEVIVVDNNTRDEAVWRPVEAHCRKLGERFRFFHVAPLAGFKAGALNYALAQTAPMPRSIAVIDSDYKVEPNWLPDLVPAFDNPRIAIVQAPQDYRDENDNAFKAMCYAEYRGFFYIGMITRNERNAIIQHGTMTLVRRYVLAAVGGWAEWCITEDAELGLRVFEAGYEAIYIPHSYGSRPDARHLHRLQAPALPLGLWRDADPAPSRGRAAAPVAQRADRRPALSLHRRLAALDRRRLQPAVQYRRDRLVDRDDHGAAEDRSAADGVLGAAAVAVHVQAGEAGAPVHPPRRHERAPDRGGGHLGPGAGPHHRPGGPQGTAHRATSRSFARRSTARRTAFFPRSAPRARRRC